MSISIIGVEVKGITIKFKDKDGEYKTDGINKNMIKTMIQGFDYLNMKEMIEDTIKKIDILIKNIEDSTLYATISKNIILIVNNNYENYKEIAENIKNSIYNVNVLTIGDVFINNELITDYDNNYLILLIKSNNKQLQELKKSLEELKDKIKDTDTIKNDNNNIKITIHFDFTKDIFKKVFDNEINTITNEYSIKTYITNRMKNTNEIRQKKIFNHNIVLNSEIINELFNNQYYINKKNEYDKKIKELKDKELKAQKEIEKLGNKPKKTEDINNKKIYDKKLSTLKEDIKTKEEEYNKEKTIIYERRIEFINMTRKVYDDENIQKHYIFYTKRILDFLKKSIEYDYDKKGKIFKTDDGAFDIFKVILNEKLIKKFSNDIDGIKYKVEVLIRDLEDLLMRNYYILDENGSNNSNGIITKFINNNEYTKFINNNEYTTSINNCKKSIKEINNSINQLNHYLTNNTIDKTDNSINNKNDNDYSLYFNNSGSLEDDALIQLVDKIVEKKTNNNKEIKLFAYFSIIKFFVYKMKKDKKYIKNIEKILDDEISRIILDKTIENIISHQIIMIIKTILDKINELEISNNKTTTIKKEEIFGYENNEKDNIDDTKLEDIVNKIKGIDKNTNYFNVVNDIFSYFINKVIENISQKINKNEEMSSMIKIIKTITDTTNPIKKTVVINLIKEYDEKNESIGKLLYDFFIDDTSNIHFIKNINENVLIPLQNKVDGFIS